MNGLAEIRRANATRPDFQKRHFCLIAEVIANTRRLPHDDAQEAFTDLIENLCVRLKLDNKDFDATTFRTACGVNGHDFKREAHHG